MIADSGEKVTLRLVAQYVDARNIMNSPEVVEHEYGVIRHGTHSRARPACRLRQRASGVDRLLIPALERVKHLLMAH
jgi:hypothetical protein